MKVTVHIRIFDETKVLEIPCGIGDKTFKWLAVVASQRIAAMAPNGDLRRKEGIRGATEKVQHLPYEVYLDNGDVMHPNAQLVDWIKDGDVVYIGLQDSQSILKNTFSPSKSKWSLASFEHGSHTSLGKAEAAEEEDPDEGVSAEEIAKKLGKANFMKIMLKSQMINQRQIEHSVGTIWEKSIAVAMPLLKSHDGTGIKLLLEQNWDITYELFRKFSNDNFMTSEGHYQVCDAIKLYPPEDMSRLVRRNFEKSQRAMRAQNMEYMNIYAFIVSLVLHSQSRFHDMSDSSLTSLLCVESFQELYSKCIRPWAKESAISAYLKEEFCKDNFLASIRDSSEDLFKLFQKYASKSKDVPTSLELVHLTELLSDSKLIPGGAPGLAQSKELLTAVREGSIYGDATRTELELSELKFPEFIEVLARAGFFKFNIDNSSNVELYFMKGIRACLDYKPEPPPARK
jgi:hypothetical protein